MKELSGVLFVIALMNVLERSGVHEIDEDQLIHLLSEGANAVMKSDREWSVGDFVPSDRSFQKERREVSADAIARFLVFLQTQNVLELHYDGHRSYTLEEHVREELRTSRSRKEMGFEEPIVIVACHPARKWAHKEHKFKKKS